MLPIFHHIMPTYRIELRRIKSNNPYFYWLCLPSHNFGTPRFSQIPPILLGIFRSNPSPPLSAKEQSQRLYLQVPVLVMLNFHDAKWRAFWKLLCAKPCCVPSRKGKWISSFLTLCPETKVEMLGVLMS